MKRNLAEFLVADARPNGTMNYPQLYGFLFAIAASPESIDRSLWMPMIFHNQPENYQNKQQQLEISNSITDTFDEISHLVKQNIFQFPDYFRPSEELMENFEEDSQIAHWGRGFIFGHEWLEELWKAYLPQQMQEELASTISILSFFANEEKSRQYSLSLLDNGVDLDVVAETVISTFDNAANAYAHLGMTIRNALLEQKDGPEKKDEYGDV